MSRSRSASLSYVDILCMTAAESQAIASFCRREVERLSGSEKPEHRKSLQETKLILSMI